jgi:ABC-type branched-subunit amino acid transport system ATPase component
MMAVDHQPLTSARFQWRETYQGAGLEVENLTVKYGGQAAVDGFSFQAPLGRATGLIGPNGAGKTTTFNACSGMAPVHTGTVTLFEQNITHISPSRRAQRGLGRTFQRVELCEELTVAENVLLGCESRAAGVSFYRQLFALPREQSELRRAAEEALELCGLDHQRDRLAASLSTGERRLVELARAIAADFDILMLDEPSSGLDTSETRSFGAILQSVVHTRGVGLLLVEHDMSLVRAICETVYVLDFGHLLTSGPTDEVLGSEIVRDAYLGTVADDV